MATIYLDNTVTAEAEQRVREIAERVLLVDPDWSGATINVERGDFTFVDADDEIAGTSLLADVYGAIDGIPYSYPPNDLDD